MILWRASSETNKQTTQASLANSRTKIDSSAHFSYVHLKILKKILEKNTEKNIQKFFIFFKNIFFNIFVHFQDDHRKDSTEIQFHANSPLISCGKKYI